MESSNEIDVLMVSLPYQGHINPMLRFSELLTSRGVHVTLATTEVARCRFDTNKNFSSQIQFEFFSDGFIVGLDREKNISVLLEESLPTKGAENLSNLINCLSGKGKTFSCVIINCFVPWVVDVAVRHNIPCAILWVQSCITYVIYYRYHKGWDTFPALENSENVVDLPGMPLLKVDDLPTFMLPSCPSHFKNVIRNTIHKLDRVNWVLGSSFYDLEEDIVKSMDTLKPIQPIGPLVPRFMFERGDLMKDEDICLYWLDKKPSFSVVYIALGSISVLSQEETKAMAMALESSKMSFLWVMKEGESGWGRKVGELPNGFLENTKDKGLVVPWCSQAKVLMHSAVACFLTHCGWNSTLEAVVAGVPVIAYPDWTDQATNAKLLVDVFEMGVKIKKGKDNSFNKDEIARCIMEVTNGPKASKMKEMAMKWKDRAKKATSNGGFSNQNIKKFICEISGKFGSNLSDV